MICKCQYDCHNGSYTIGGSNNMWCVSYFWVIPRLDRKARATVTSENGLIWPVFATFLQPRNERVSVSAGIPSFPSLKQRVYCVRVMVKFWICSLWTELNRALCNNLWQLTFINHFFIWHMWADCEMSEKWLHLYKSVDDVYKLFNAVGLWIFSVNNSCQTIHDSPKDVNSCMFSNSSSKCFSPIS